MSTQKTFEAEILSLLQRMATAIESLAADRQKPARKSKVSRQKQAMVFVVANQCTDLSIIAAEFGVTRRAVERWKQLRTLIDNLEAVDARGPADGFMTDNGVDGIY